MKKIPNDYPIDFSYCKTIKLLQNQEVNCVLLALFFDIIPLCYQVQDDVCKHLFTFCINVSGSFNKDYLVFILTFRMGINMLSVLRMRNGRRSRLSVRRSV